MSIKLTRKCEQCKKERPGRFFAVPGGKFMCKTCAHQWSAENALKAMRKAEKRWIERLQMDVEDEVIQKIRNRRDAGRKKYGTTMERTDLSRLDWLRHAQEEAMDLAIYLEKLIRMEASSCKSANA